MDIYGRTRDVLTTLIEHSSSFVENKTVRGVTEGLVNLIPFVLIGSICLAIGNLPIPPLHTFLNSITANHWTLISDIIIFSTEHILSLAALLSVSFSLASQDTVIQKREISLFLPLYTTFVCYVILMVWDPLSYLMTPEGQTPDAVFTDAGQNGIFFAIFVAVVSSKLFAAFSRLWQRFPWSQGRVLGTYHLVRIAIHSVFPILLTIFSFVLLRLLLDWVLGEVDVTLFLSELVTSLASEGSLGSVLLIIVMIQFLWFFGAHGSNTIKSLMDTMNTQASVDNILPAGVGASAFETTGSSMQNFDAAVIDPSAMFAHADFYSVFVDMGGTGTSMGLLLALFIFGSAGRGKRLGRISAFPMAFNINETLLFGIPLVLNPLFLVPFVLAPVLSATVAFVALSTGIVPPMANYVEWTTPILFSGYLSTGSIAGSLLQLVCIGLAFLVYTPFVVIARESTARMQLKTFDSFKKAAAYAANNEQASLVNRRDKIGEMTREFLSELHFFFDNKTIPFFLVYQPKTDGEGRVVGAEALLRWTHPSYGSVPPDILIELADEADLSVPMGRWITAQALEECARWQRQGLKELMLSINLNPYHLFGDEDFPAFLQEELKKHDLSPALIDLEITEHAAVHASSAMLDMFRKLRRMGLRLSIDDMGMGYSSLTYISDFEVSVIKIDISLIDKIAVDVRQQEIVRSVVELAQQLNLAIIVEGVEKKEQVEKLTELGCHYFQGYYFSKPLSTEDFLAYVSENGTAVLKHEGECVSESMP